jgi:hypothetical protein
VDFNLLGGDISRDRTVLSEKKIQIERLEVKLTAPLNGYSGKPSESLRTGAFLSQTIIQK